MGMIVLGLFYWLVGSFHKYCYEYGICREGDVIENCKVEGDTCIVDEQSCKQLEGDWSIIYRQCDLSKPLIYID
jgi:hypothetical protein